MKNIFSLYFDSVSLSCLHVRVQNLKRKCNSCQVQLKHLHLTSNGNSTQTHIIEIILWHLYLCLVAPIVLTMLYGICLTTYSTNVDISMMTIFEMSLPNIFRLDRVICKLCLKNGCHLIVENVSNQSKFGIRCDCLDWIHKLYACLLIQSTFIFNLHWHWQTE